MLKKYFFMVLVAIIMGFTVNAYAVLQIDGNLNDWGVSVFSDLIPSSSTAEWTVSDNKMPDGQPVRDNSPELYDVEALYFDSDQTNFYFAMVGSYPLTLEEGGDVAGDMAIDLNPQDSYYNYGVKISRGFGRLLPQNSIQNLELWKNPVWVNSAYSQFSPLSISGGTKIGSAQVFYKNLGFIEGEVAGFSPSLRYIKGNTYVLEGSIDRSYFDEFPPGESAIRLHWAESCNNDYINLNGDFDTTIPDPATMSLLGLGFFGMLKLRRKT